MFYVVMFILKPQTRVQKKLTAFNLTSTSVLKNGTWKGIMTPGAEKKKRKERKEKEKKRKEKNGKITLETPLLPRLKVAPVKDLTLTINLLRIFFSPG